MKDRIRKIMEEQQMTQQEFAQKLNISPSSLSSVFKGRTEPTNNHTKAIHEAFPEININWLLFGEGEKMYDEASNDISPVASLEETERDLFSNPPLLEKKEIAKSSSSSQSVPKNTSAVYSKSDRSLEERTEPEKNIEYIKRTVQEIRLFYDDGMFESFIPSK